jgi:hypothetical protein
MAEEPDPRTIAEALERQQRDPDEHDLSLIEESLRLTPAQRLQRLEAWVNFTRRARPAPPHPQS